MGKTIVIGLGNPIMGDDGLGIAALRLLEASWAIPRDVELVDGGTWGMNLLGVVEDAARVLFIDAIDAGRTPGSFLSLERPELPKLLTFKLSPHQVDLHDVLALAELRGTLPQDTVALGLQPARVEMSTELSPPLEARLANLVQHVVERLRVWGHDVQRREQAAEPCTK